MVVQTIGNTIPGGWIVGLCRRWYQALLMLLVATDPKTAVVATAVPVRSSVEAKPDSCIAEGHPGASDRCRQAGRCRGTPKRSVSIPKAGAHSVPVELDIE